MPNITASTLDAPPRTKGCCQPVAGLLPDATAAELAVLLPGVEVLQDWKGPEHLEAQRSQVPAFLEKHTPH